jgi:hypothetical protein
MSELHKRAMEAVLQAAAQDVASTLRERGLSGKEAEEVDDAVLDVAILHAYRIFFRICQDQGLIADPSLFSDLASDFAEEMLTEDASDQSD